MPPYETFCVDVDDPLDRPPSLIGGERGDDHPMASAGSCFLNLSPRLPDQRLQHRNRVRSQRGRHAHHPAKHRRRILAGTPATVPLIGPFFYDYTVFIDDEHFTVTEPNDMRFLEFLYGRIITPEDDEAPAPAGPAGPVTRFLRWMSQPI
jgi:hypothetical protein